MFRVFGLGVRGFGFRNVGFMVLEIRGSRVLQGFGVWG